MIKINKEEISGLLNVAGSIIKKNNLVPMAENIHLTCKGGNLRIRSTDIENQYESTLNVEGDDEFEFSLPSPEFIGTITKLNRDEFELSYHVRENNSSYCQIKCGRGKYKIEATQDPFPFNELPETDAIELDFETLAKSFKKASTCPDLKDLRPQFTGVGILPYERGIKITGTRHNMLTKQMIECNGEITDCLVPLRFANIISGLQFKGMCKVYRDKQRLGINILGTKITTQFIDTNPIDQEKLFDHRPQNSITVNRMDTLGAIKRVGNFAYNDVKSKENISRIILEVKGEVINLIGDQTFKGNYAEEDVTIKNEGVDEMRIGVNALQLDNIFSNIESEYVQVFIQAPNSPLHFIPLGHESEVQNWINSTIVIKNES